MHPSTNHITRLSPGTKFKTANHPDNPMSCQRLMYMTAHGHTSGKPISKLSLRNMSGLRCSAKAIRPHSTPRTISGTTKNCE